MLEELTTWPSYFIYEILKPLKVVSLVCEDTFVAGIQIQEQTLLCLT